MLTEADTSIAFDAWTWGVIRVLAHLHKPMAGLPRPEMRSGADAGMATDTGGEGGNRTMVLLAAALLLSFTLIVLATAAISS
jgi:hypothetical protein